VYAAEAVAAKMAAAAAAREKFDGDMMIKDLLWYRH
jgi:hypothetical protein